MAATSLWHIEGRLKDLISYVENPEKTVPNKEMQDFFDVFSYVKNPQKTDNGEFVSAINCLKETALQQMILTKKQYQKTGGYIAWHGYQSFKPDEVTPDFIRSHLGTRARYGNYKAKISYSPHMPEEYKKAWKPHQKTRGILALYYYWCYQLGIFPKGTDYKPTSPLMKEELRKLDEITTQVRYMSEHNISTLSDLHADREKNQTEMDRLTNYRRHLQNKIRRASPAEKETLREEKNGVTERITELRKRLKYADGIEKRSAHIDDCLNQIHDTVENQRSNQNGRTDRKREDALR